jgi:hypothetical protein
MFITVLILNPNITQFNSINSFIHHFFIINFNIIVYSTSSSLNPNVFLSMALSKKLNLFRVAYGSQFAVVFAFSSSSRSQEGLLHTATHSPTSCSSRNNSILLEPGRLRIQPSSVSFNAHQIHCICRNKLNM